MTREQWLVLCGMECAIVQSIHGLHYMQNGDNLRHVIEDYAAGSEVISHHNPTRCTNRQWIEEAISVASKIYGCVNLKECIR